jgi:HNH endonuclease
MPTLAEIVHAPDWPLLLGEPITVHHCWDVISTARMSYQQQAKARANRKYRAARAKITTEFRREVWKRDGGRCTRCGNRVNVIAEGNYSDMHLHHENGRGLGGGKRNDVFEECSTLCVSCHRKEHNQ